MTEQNQRLAAIPTLVLMVFGDTDKFDYTPSRISQLSSSDRFTNRVTNIAVLTSSSRSKYSVLWCKYLSAPPLTHALSLASSVYKLCPHLQPIECATHSSENSLNKPKARWKMYLKIIALSS